MPPDDTNGDADGDPVCGSTDTVDGSACQNPVDSADLTCYLHGADGEPQGQGAPEGNTNSVGNDGGAPEGNKNSLSHGIYAAERDPTGLFNYFREDNPAMAAMIRRWFWSYMDDAPFTAYAGDGFDRYNPPVMDIVDVDRLNGQQGAAQAAEGLDTVTVADGPPRQQASPDAPPIDVQGMTGKGHRLFVVCVHQAVTTMVTLEQAETTLTRNVERYTDQGQPYEVEEELPANLPKSRLRQRDLRELKDLGIVDDSGDADTGDAANYVDVAREVAKEDDATDGADGVDSNIPDDALPEP